MLQTRKYPKNTMRFGIALALLVNFWTTSLRAQRSDLDRALELGKLLEQCRAEAKAEAKACEAKSTARLDAQKREFEIRSQYAKRISDAKIQALNTKLDATDKALDRAEEALQRRWYQSPSLWFWAGLTAGTLSGFGLAVASVWGVSQLTTAPLRPAL